MRLHIYQEQAKHFILKNLKCALFFDMGMGKTAITLHVIETLLWKAVVKRVLIIAPKRVCNTVWKQELAKWDSLNDKAYMSIAICTTDAKDKKRRQKALAQDARITLTNKENVVWLTKNYPWKWDMVVIDESSAFKNRNKRWQALKRFTPMLKSCVLLSGTPSPKGYEDLWSQMYLLDGGMRLFPTITGFRDNFCYLSVPEYFKYEVKKDCVPEIKKRMSDICLTMKAQDYLQVPRRINLYHRLKFDKDTAEKYKELKKEFLLNVGGKDVAAYSESQLVQKLLQICNGAVYDEHGKVQQIHDAKIKALEELMEDNPSENVLVAYNFQHDLSRLRKAFPYAVALDTEGKAVEAWNRGEIRMLLAHPQSAGHGLNMQEGGSMLVWFSLMWNLEYYQQFNARLHRQGQKKPVRIVHLMMSGSIDEAILQILKKKDATQADLLNFLKKNLTEF